MVFFWSLLFALVSFAAELFAVKSVNRLLDSETFSIKYIDPNRVKKYIFDNKLYLFFVLLSVVSGYLGYSFYCSLGNQLDVVGNLEIVRMLICLVVFVIAAIYDFRLRIIPNYIPLSLLICRLVYFGFEVFIYEDYLTGAVFSLIALCVVFLVLTFANKLAHNGIGAGDVKLLSAVSFFAGFSFVVPLIFVSFVSCGIISVVLILSKKLTSKDALPFAPFILLGFILCSIIGF